MGDSEHGDERDALIQTVTEAYSRGAMEMAAFEKAVTRLNTCADRSALEAEAGQLASGCRSPLLRSRPSSPTPTRWS